MLAHFFLVLPSLGPLWTEILICEKWINNASDFICQHARTWDHCRETRETLAQRLFCQLQASVSSPHSCFAPSCVYNDRRTAAFSRFSTVRLIYFPPIATGCTNTQETGVQHKISALQASYINAWSQSPLLPSLTGYRQELKIDFGTDFAAWDGVMEPNCED